MNDETTEAVKKIPSENERLIGLELFANDFDGFNCIFKRNVSDFIVNEIAECGTVCKLTTLEPIIDQELEKKEKELFNSTTTTRTFKQKTKEDDNERDVDDDNNKNENSVVGIIEEEIVKEEIFDDFAKIASNEDDVARLRKFLNTPGVRKGTNPLVRFGTQIEPLVLAPSRDKEHRKQLHAFFRQFQLDTDSVTLNNEHPNTMNGQNLCLRVHPSTTSSSSQKSLNGKNNNNNKRDSRDDGHDRKDKNKRQKADARQNTWPPDLPKTLQFTLCKSGRDTTDALNALGSLLRCDSKRFQIAGSKDKKAVTTQRVTIYKYRATRLAFLNNNKALKDIKIGNFEYVERPLYFGKSLGNAFTICLRDLDREKKDIVLAAVDALRENGTINYFGAQRFGNVSSFASKTENCKESKEEGNGTTSTGTTHRIGALLLNGEFKRAIDLILQPKFTKNESLKIKQAKERYLKDQDAKEALKTFPRFMHIERAILEVKATKGRENDLSGQLSAIPSKMKRMYINAFQSYLWNKVASERVRRFGVNTVVVGDLVVIKDDTGKTAKEIRKISDEAYDKGLKSEVLQKVKVVTAEDVAKNAFDPSDVVLPVPGHAIEYPAWKIITDNDEHEMDAKALFLGLAKNEDGVDLEQTKHSVKEFSISSFPGDYRRLFLKPKDLRCEFIHYHDQKIDLVETEMDRIAKTTGRDDRNGNNNSNNKDDVPEEVKEVQKKFLAAKLTFSLGAGEYATMILRELTKGNAKEHSFD